MSTESNVFSQGGGGTLFEFETHAAFFTTFLIGGQLPGGEDERIFQYRQQSSSIGYRTDDLFLTTKNLDGGLRRVLIQIKHGLIISKSDETWQKVLLAAWIDFSNIELFDKSKDRIVLIKDNLTKKEKNHLKEVINWAKLKTNEDDYLQEVTRISAKKEYYDMFAETLGKEGLKPTSKELYEFFRCFDLWEYDFGHVSSVTRSNFLNLIELSKSSSRLTAGDIWSKVVKFVSSSDSRGGMFEWEKLPKDLVDLFNPSYYPQIQKQLLALNEQSKEIIDLIQETIGIVTLNRQILYEASFNALENFQVLIISGQPGSGKSAIAKRILNARPSSIIAIRADELATGNLIDVLKAKGMDLTVRDFFNHFPLYEQHIIYVDALEKLLEGEGRAFQQLLAAVHKRSNIKLIASCRSNNFRLLEIKYFSEYTFFRQDIGFLSDAELDIIVERQSELIPLIQNRRLSGLIKVPKYLDFAYKAIKVSGKTFSEINESDFIQDLWEIIVENKLEELSSGLPARRRATFIEIAVSRAKKMIPFVDSSNCDAEALEKLEKDNVIIRSRQNLYAPGPDVLVDWALIRHVNSCFNRRTNALSFFIELGTEPAMRRAYRLWVQQSLSEQDLNKISFFSENLNNTEIERFWQDESLIALLNSPYVYDFAAKNEAALKAKDWTLFFRMVHILRTACRENKINSWSNRQYIPVGPGWDMVVKFFHKYRTNFPEKNYELLLLTLEDYSKLLDSSESLSLKEAGQVGLFLLEFFKKKAEYYYDDTTVERCLTLVFQFCAGITQELGQLFEMATEMDKKDDRTGNWIETRYYQKIVTNAIGGLRSGQLSKHYPDLLIQWAKNRWYYASKNDKSSRSGSFMFGGGGHDDERESAFGLNSEREFYSTASSYHTFILSLLRYHPDLGIKFIVGFIDDVTNDFLKGQGANDKQEFIFEVKLPDERVTSVIGLPEFWIAYRGAVGGIPKLIESILMALERYLIELGNIGEGSRLKLQLILERLYTESHSLFITGVLSSVCQAHPLLAGDWVLPLFTNEAFFYWDLSRYTRDLMDDILVKPDDEYYKEREEADSWKHRKEFYRGLRGFITYPPLYMEGLGNRIFQIIDDYREKVNNDDFEWRRVLDDMDLRKYRVKDIVAGEDGKKMALFQPEYDADVAQNHERSLEKMPFDPQNTTDSVWMNKILENSEIIDLDNWREIYNRYRNITTFIWHEHAPGLLAGIAIRDIWDSLSREEREWCVNIVLTSLRRSLEETDVDFKVSVFDNRAIHMALPILLYRSGIGPEITEIQQLLFDLITTHTFDEQSLHQLCHSFSDFVWAADRGKWRAWWAGIIKFSYQVVSRPSTYLGTAEEIEDYEKKSKLLFNEVISNKVEINFDEISEGRCDANVLANVVRMLPVSDINDEHVDFIIRMVNLYIKHEESKTGRARRGENSAIEIQLKASLVLRVSSVILNNANVTGRRLFDNFLERVTANDFLDSISQANNNSLSFFTETMQRVFLLVDQSIKLDGSEKARVIANFQEQWEYMDAYLSARNSFLFSDFLLLNTEWHPGTRHWEPIETMIPFFERMIDKYGVVNIAPLINLLTHPANDLLMPKGISLLADTIKKAPFTRSLSYYKFSEKFIQRAYDFFLEGIKSNKKIFSDYLWLLDQLMAEGSSDAYWIREFVISFRNA